MRPAIARAVTALLLLPTAAAAQGAETRPEVKFEQRFRGTAVVVWNATNRARADQRWEVASMALSPGSEWMFDALAYDFDRHSRIRIRVGRQQGDSSVLLVTAERFTGQIASGRVRVGAEDWRPVREGELEAQYLHNFAEARRAIPYEPPPDAKGFFPPPSEVDGTRPFRGVPADRELRGGRRASCRARQFDSSGWLTVDRVREDWCVLDPSDERRFVNNVLIKENPADKPVGATMLICATSLLPPGWRLIEMRWDASRCPRDPDDRFRANPNVHVIVRER